MQSCRFCSSCCQKTLETSSQSFYVDFDPPSVGIIYKNGSKSETRGDFSIELVSLVEADANTGYLANVTRAVDGKKG